MRKLYTICLIFMILAVTVSPVSFALRVEKIRQKDEGQKILPTEEERVTGRAPGRIIGLDKGEEASGGSSPFANEDDYFTDEEDGMGDPFDGDNDMVDRIGAGEDNMGTTD